jgi:RND family efflux transporter MFP subunit
VVARRELDSGMADLASAEIAKTDADSRLLIANEALTREESIARKGLRTASEIQRAEGAAQVARANAASARSQLEGARAESIRAQNSLRVAASQVTLLGGAPGGGNRITVSAPIGGEVERRTVSAGQTVSAGEELYELLNAEVVWILCDVYEGDIARVRAGQQVTVTVDALKGSVYEGEVAFVHNEVDQTTRTTKVRIVVPNPGERLKQNMFARVRIGSAAGPRVLVPTESVQRVGGLDVVFVEEAPGTYRRTLVQTGGSLGGRTVLLAGVEAGERVVTDGSYQLA